MWRGGLRVKAGPEARGGTGERFAHPCADPCAAEYTSTMQLPDGRARKCRKSFDIEGHAHELTFSCYRRMRLLNHDRTREWFADSLERSRSELGFLLLAYVIMPEHVHVLVFPRSPECTVARILKAVKEPVSRRAVRWLRDRDTNSLARLRVEYSSGRVEHHFWQPGGGYDRNIYTARALARSIDYIHLNPVRAQLVKHRTEWPWSSARFYAGVEDVPITMDRIEDR